MDLRQIAKTVFRVRFLRVLLLLALAIPLAIPVYYAFWQLPQYHNLLVNGARQDAVTVARHIAGTLLNQTEPLTAERLPPRFSQHAKEAMDDFDLHRLRIYGVDGTVIHSAEASEVGQAEQHDYFRQKVMAGEVYTDLVTFSPAEQGERPAIRALVATYVPVIAGGRFLGAIGIEYNVTGEKAAFDNLHARSRWLTLFLTSGLMGVLLIALFHAGRDVAAREAVQRTLTEREALLRSITTSAKDAIIMIDSNGRIVYWNRASESLFGYRESEALDQPIHEIIAPHRYLADSQRGFSQFRLTGKGPVVGETTEVVGRRRDGSEFPVELSVSAVQRNSSWYAIGIVRDISERKRLERHLQMGSRVMAHAHEGIMVVDAYGRIEMVNPAFTDITGYTAAEVVGRNPNLLQSGRHDRAFYKTLWQELDEKGSWQGEVWNRRKDGDIYPELLSISVVRNGEGELANYIGIFSDITRRKESEQRLERLAFHDPLTGLANRLLFMDRLRQALRQARRNQEPLAVLFIDLDRFKQVNDQYGHHVGDLLLQQAALRIESLLREEDTVARLGGDEFIVLLQGNGQIDEVSHVAEKLRAALAQPFELGEYCCEVGSSIGIAFYPTDADSTEALIERADAAMYRAKQTGKNRICFYAGNHREGS
ncbi:MAG: PAS domain S-box protein [Gammaproteobacteria bacterium]|nr:PAS domain S-box protein [Gammaproteobacteria bacterium]